MNQEFQEFPKIARLSRECVVTEKIDGTNASIFIEELEGHPDPEAFYCTDGLAMRVGSRTRWITLENDNHGFARWAWEHKDELLQLGPGHHFGEWWGSGIQRGYGLEKGEKRFSLFNTTRWNAAYRAALDGHENNFPTCCHVVPELYRGIFDTKIVFHCLDELDNNGSYASPGFMRPEGIVVFHTAANIMFKKTIEKDDVPKGLQK